jgi:phospholipid N-methyltransferase
MNLIQRPKASRIHRGTKEPKLRQPRSRPVRRNGKPVVDWPKLFFTHSLRGRTLVGTKPRVDRSPRPVRPARAGGQVDQQPTSRSEWLDDQVQFFREFLRHPRQVASVIPSSPFLERRIVQAARIRSARVIVELGAGTGGTTRALLRAMSDDAHLLSIEINPHFHDCLCRIDDRRLTPHPGDAEQLQHVLSLHGFHGADAIVSGIPFSTMGQPAASRILQAICSALKPEGRFVAYQWSKRVGDLGGPIFGPAKVQTELLNIPPIRVYRWTKPA